MAELKSLRIGAVTAVTALVVGTTTFPTVQQAIDYATARSFPAWEMLVAPGPFTASFVVPSNVTTAVEGTARDQTTLGPVTVGQSSSITFEDLTLNGPVSSADGTVAFTDCIFGSSGSVTFVSGSGTVLFDGPSRFAAIQANTPVTSGTVINRDLLQQVTVTELGIDASTTSQSFVGLLTASITTTKNSKLLLQASMGASLTATNHGVYLRFLFDGVVKRGCATNFSANPAASLSLSCPITGSAAGPHTVILEWRTDSPTTLRCRPVAAPDAEHACMVITETMV